MEPFTLGMIAVAGAFASFMAWGRFRSRPPRIDDEETAFRENLAQLDWDPLYRSGTITQGRLRGVKMEVARGTSGVIEIQAESLDEKLELSAGEPSLPGVPGVRSLGDLEAALVALAPETRAQLADVVGRGNGSVDRGVLFLSLSPGLTNHEVRERVETIADLAAKLRRIGHPTGVLSQRSRVDEDPEVRVACLEHLLLDHESADDTREAVARANPDALIAARASILNRKGLLDGALAISGDASKTGAVSEAPPEGALSEPRKR